MEISKKEVAIDSSPSGSIIRRDYDDIPMLLPEGIVLMELTPR